MALPARKLDLGNLDDWVSIETAERLTGLGQRGWRKRCQALEARGLACKARSASGRGAPGWWIHRSVDGRLSRCPDRSALDQLAGPLRFPAHHVARAELKLR